MKSSHGFIVVCALIVSACGGRARPAVTPTAPSQPPGPLSATKFVAFGDSITEGFVQKCPGSPERTAGGARAGFLIADPRSQFSPVSYPVKLQALLAARYPNQPISVVNEGLGGEEIATGAADLPRVLTADTPEVLLLQEGINTLNGGHSGAIAPVVEGLRTMIREAKGRGITVFVGTLLPERKGSCRAYDYLDDVDDIVPANVRIREMVGLEGATLVDLYETFNGQTARLIGEDGLHPSVLGYEAIAHTFFDAIIRRLEHTN